MNTFEWCLYFQYLLLFRKEAISIFVSCKFSVLVHNSFSLSMVIPWVDKNRFKILKWVIFLPIISLCAIKIWCAPLQFVSEGWQKPVVKSSKMKEICFLVNLWKGCLVTINLTDDSSFSIVLICFFLIKGAACLACWLGCLDKQNWDNILCKNSRHILFVLFFKLSNLSFWQICK